MSIGSTEATLPIAPIDAVPPEILSEIFICAAENSTFDNCKTLRGIMLTCRQWKSIAEDLPELWYFISLPWESRPPSQSTTKWMTRAVRMIQIWLIRAKNRPLRIRLAYDARNWLWSEEVVILDLIQTQIGRWERLSIAHAFLDAWLLSITFRNWDRSSSRPKDFTGRISLPNLKELEIIGRPAVATHPTPFAAPLLSKLIIRSLAVINVKEYAALVAATPNVSWLELDDVGFSGLFEKDPIIIGHPRLLHLHFHCKNGVVGEGASPPGYPSGIFVRLVSSAKDIQTVRVCITDLLHLDSLSKLEVVPSVTHLHLYHKRTAAVPQVLSDIWELPMLFGKFPNIQYLWHSFAPASDLALGSEGDPDGSLWRMKISGESTQNLSRGLIEGIRPLQNLKEFTVNGPQVSVWPLVTNLMASLSYLSSEFSNRKIETKVTAKGFMFKLIPNS